MEFKKLGGLNVRILKEIKLGVKTKGYIKVAKWLGVAVEVVKCALLFRTLGMCSRIFLKQQVA